MLPSSARVPGAIGKTRVEEFISRPAILPADRREPRAMAIVPTPRPDKSTMRARAASGRVEVDGCYFGGIIRPANRKEDRIDRRLAANKSDKRRVVVVARERKGRTITTVTKTEADGLAFVESVVSPPSTIHADAAPHWDALHAKYATVRINHSEAIASMAPARTKPRAF